MLGMPFDLQESEWDNKQTSFDISESLIPVSGRVYPDPQTISEISRLIKAAKRPLIVGGRGAMLSNAGPECETLAEKIGALLVTTLPARGLFVNSPFSLNITGGFASDTAREACNDADLVIAVGTSLASHSTDSGRLYKNAKILHIDLISRIYSQGRVAAHFHIRADAKVGIKSLIKGPTKR